MCSRYEAPSSQRLLEAFQVAPDEPTQTELWPTYVGPFLRAPSDEGVNHDARAYEALSGIFGLLPFWAKDTKLARRTYNARSETAAEKNSFRGAWKSSQHCIIPAVAIYEPDWRSGKAVPTRISRADGGLMSIAGLWDRWTGPAGEDVYSFSMLTINADDHPLMRNYHRPDDEKRMVVILPNGAINDWLRAPPEQSMEFMLQYPADRLVAEARPSKR
ncbi:SOS response-associated peptidase (plasmid) [Halopseudomonas sp. SMJS2]|uniref:SOS response-associated peptidase n=1 Tax=Halopseudomonas sp. SMJS2 TaxID=3041098 RepID=UPI002452C9F2|nr:SOS response-associated peptidase [Halopseudomonas sp. SMJS2]WGK63497.1 SOS response-associated peptidase [Halopseudomonas sp. SMJS2]